MADERPEQMWPSDILVGDAIGRLIEFWGFKRNMGRVWTVLYLSDDPLTAADLRQRLKLSSGAVSMTLKELSRWGVVKKVWIQGERRDHYVAEANLWKMIRRVYRERERVEVLEAIDAMERAMRMLEERAKSAEPAERARARSRLARVRRLLDLARLGRRLIDALVDRGRVDASPLVKFLLGDEPGR